MGLERYTQQLPSTTRWEAPLGQHYPVAAVHDNAEASESDDGRGTAPETSWFRSTVDRESREGEITEIGFYRSTSSF